MQFKITLKKIDYSKGIIPLNYQYPLSAVIYKIIERADQAYALFLHEEGYGDGLKKFKFFTFSDLRTPFRIKGDRLLMLNDEAYFIVSFHLPLAAAGFIKGLFMNQKLEIADSKSKTTFTVSQVEALPVEIDANGISELILSPCSPIVCGKKNKQNEYDFIAPDHPDYTFLLLRNWREKYIALYGTEQAALAFAGAGLDVVFLLNPPKSRLITIKANSLQETRIRGYVNFNIKVRARKDALELLLNTGAGVYNSLGMGSLGKNAESDKASGK